MGHHPAPRHAHQQTIENDYKRYVGSGLIRRTGVNLNHNAQKREFLEQVLAWAQNAEHAPTLLQKLERSALWAKILIDRKRDYQNHGLLHDAALKASAKNCQILMNDLFTRYNDALSADTDRLFNHAFIWWALLSMWRTLENYDEAWGHLNTVHIRKYRNVAKLCKAHLILKNNYAPHGLPHTPLVEARNLLFPPELHNVAVQDAHPPLNLIEALEHAEHGAPHHPPIVIPQAAVQIMLPNLPVVDEEPPVYTPVPAIIPPTLQDMRRLREQLREELERQEAAIQQNLQPPQAVNDEESDDSEDDDNDDNDNPPPAGGGALEQSPEHDQDQEMEDDETSEDEIHDWATDEDENVRSFLAMLDEKALDEIDNNTFKFIKNKRIGSKFKKLLAARYSDIKISGESPNTKKPPANKGNLKKREEGWKKREEGLPMMALIYHYSILLDKRAASPRILKFFAPYLPFQFSSVGDLRTYYQFPGKKADSKNRIPLFLQILAYRSEINDGTLRIDTITQAYNQKHGTNYSNLKQASFIKKEAPVLDVALLESFKNNPEKLLADLDYKRGKFLPAITMLLHHLEERDLPKKELDIAQKPVSTRFVLEPKHNQFLEEMWPNVPATKKGRDYHYVAEQFKETFGFECPLTNTALRGRFIRWQKKQPQEIEDNALNVNDIKASVKEKLSEYFCTQKEWLTYKEFLEKFPEIKDCTRHIFNSVRKSLESLPEIKDLLPELKAPASDVAFLTKYLLEKFNEGINVTYSDYQTVVPTELLLSSRSFDHYRAKVLNTVDPALQEKIKAPAPCFAYAKKVIIESLEKGANLTYRPYLKNHPQDFDPLSEQSFNAMKAKLKQKQSAGQSIGKKREAPSGKKPAAKKKKTGK